jgi:hypothetical protein
MLGVYINADGGKTLVKEGLRDVNQFVIDISWFAALLEMHKTSDFRLGA